MTKNNEEYMTDDINFEMDKFEYDIDELIDSPPFELSPIAISHYCELMTAGGKKWSTMVGRGEKCPVCGKMELDDEGNKVK